MLPGLVLICLASISWGTTGATMSLLARDAAAGPLLVGWVRVAVAAPCLLLAALLARAAEPRTPEADQIALGSGSRVLAYLVLGATMAAYQVCYFSAVTLCGVAVTALLAICSAPLLIAVLAAVFLDERLTPTSRLSLVMAVLGTALLVLGPRGFGEIGGHFGIGVVLALGAGLSYAAYAVSAKRLLSRRPPLEVSAATFTVAALLLSPTLFAAGPIRAPIVAGWPWLVYLGTGPTAAAYVLFTTGLRRVPATRAGIVSLLEPLTASILGVLYFGESLGVAGWLGAALLLGALATLAGARPDS
jgi:DME family drug/metabolite transporter